MKVVWIRTNVRYNPHKKLKISIASIYILFATLTTYGQTSEKKYEIRLDLRTHVVGNYLEIEIFDPSENMRIKFLENENFKFLDIKIDSALTHVRKEILPDGDSIFSKVHPTVLIFQFLKSGKLRFPSFEMITKKGRFHTEPFDIVVRTIEEYYQEHQYFPSLNNKNIIFNEILNENVLVEFKRSRTRPRGKDSIRGNLKIYKRFSNPITNLGLSFSKDKFDYKLESSIVAEKRVPLGTASINNKTYEVTKVPVIQINTGNKDMFRPNAVQLIMRLALSRRESVFGYMYSQEKDFIVPVSVSDNSRK